MATKTLYLNSTGVTPSNIHASTSKYETPDIAKNGGTYRIAITIDLNKALGAPARGTIINSVNLSYTVYGDRTGAFGSKGKVETGYLAGDGSDAYMVDNGTTIGRGSSNATPYTDKIEYPYIDQLAGKFVILMKFTNPIATQTNSFHISNLSMTVNYELPGYIVTFKDWDGTVLKTEAVEYGSKPTAPSNPSRAQDAQYTYTFSGWSPAIGVITSDQTYTAQYTSTVRSYTATFKDWDGTVLKTQSVNYGSKPTAPSNPTRAQDAQYTYTFSGWSPAVGNITGNTTYTAQYTSTVRSYTITTKVSPTVGGTVTGGGSHKYGTKPILTANPAIGYSFSKWSDGVTTNPRTITVAGAATYTAEFTLNKINKIYVDTTQPTGIYVDETNKKLVFVINGTVRTADDSAFDTIDGYHIVVQNTIPTGMSEIKEVYVDTTKVYG